MEVEDLSKHKMDSENFSIPEETSIVVNSALDQGKKIVAVGTSTMKTLESSVSTSGRLKPNQGWTDKFIFPPFRFQICSGMVTNFHSPKSTLLMMTCAFGGYELIMEAYNEAVKEKYRFFTYGDAMLIL